VSYYIDCDVKVKTLTSFKRNLKRYLFSIAF